MPLIDKRLLKNPNQSDGLNSWDLFDFKSFKARLKNGLCL